MDLTAKMTHFEGQRSLGKYKHPILLIFVYYSPWIFCVLEFRRLFCPYFLWMSIKTLGMESVGLDDQNIGVLSSYSTKTWGEPVSYVDFHFYSQWILYDYKFRRLFFSNFLWMSVKIFLWSLLTLTPKMTHFESQTIPGTSEPLISDHGVFWWYKIYTSFLCKFFMDVC